MRVRTLLPAVLAALLLAGCLGGPASPPQPAPAACHEDTNASGVTVVSSTQPVVLSRTFRGLTFLGFSAEAGGQDAVNVTAFVDGPGVHRVLPLIRPGVPPGWEWRYTYEVVKQPADGDYTVELHAAQPTLLTSYKLTLTSQVGGTGYACGGD